MALRYILDTNICIYIAKEKPQSVLEKFKELEIGETGMSTITYGELLFGIEKSQHPQKSKKILEALLNHIPALPLHQKTGEHYAHIRAELERKGQVIGNNDLWIAAHACALKVKLVTNNVSEFSRIPGLAIENWVN